MDELVEVFKTFDCEYVFGFEKGEKKGVHHFQGYIESKVAIRPIEKFKLPKEIHWEKAKGNRRSNILYCSKDGDFASSFQIPRDRPLPEIDLYGWQLEYKKDFDEHKWEDKRTINWIWSEAGERGKSSLVRYMVRNGALICAGKAGDMKMNVVKYFEKNEEWPATIVFDVPRSMKDYLSYTGIEEIKNGVFASTKYECTTVEMPYPAVYVFANFPPDLTNQDMSADRFRVKCVDEGPIETWANNHGGVSTYNELSQFLES